MYYPYLRGRQFELIALREFAQQVSGSGGNIVPIIEPVKKTFNTLKLALPILIENNVKFALVLNPQVGEIPVLSEIITELSQELMDSSKWIPALIVTNNYTDISDIINDKGLRDVMLICSEMSDPNNEEFEKLISSEQVKYIVSKENRTLKRKRSIQNKDLIRIDDNFHPQKRNSDYLTVNEELFSEEHLYYTEDGYKGFADYTVLGSEFLEGGGAPYAVAIHLTCRKPNGVVWVKHFASTTNDDRSNIQGKFAEACQKAIAFLDKQHIKNNATDELRRYFNESKYPGLGTVKKIAIKNHLELMHEIIKLQV